MEKIIRTYKYRLYPTPVQESALSHVLDVARWVWNEALAQWEWLYKDCGLKPHKYQQRAIFGYWRNYDKEGFLNDVPYDTIDNVIRRLHKAYAAYFRRMREFPDDKDKWGKPKYKGRRLFNGLEYAYGSGIKLLETDNPRNAKLRIFKVGEVTLRLHRPIPENAKIKQVVIKREGNGKPEWYASLQLEIVIPTSVASDKPAIGIDIGLVSLITAVDSTDDVLTTGNPKWLTEVLPELRRINRKIDRQRRANNPDNYNENGTVKPGQRKWHVSNKQRKTEHRRARLYRNLKNQRWYYWHTVTDYLTRNYSVIAIEDPARMKMAFMLKNKRLARSASDAALATFRQMLAYKCAERGVELRVVHPAYTSQMCSECGLIDSDNRKSQASFVCVGCGHEENADVNAARNILNLALNGSYSPVSALTHSLESVADE